MKIAAILVLLALSSVGHADAIPSITYNCNGHTLVVNAGPYTPLDTITVSLDGRGPYKYVGEYPYPVSMEHFQLETDASVNIEVWLLGDNAPEIVGAAPSEPNPWEVSCASNDLGD